MKKKGRKKSLPEIARWRPALVLGVFVLAVAGLLAQAVNLQLVNNEWYVNQGDRRHLRVAKISAHRGAITDRHGEPLAVSTPVDAIWANPQELAAAVDRVDELAAAIGREQQWLLRRVSQNLHREFVYLRRHMAPADAAAVLALDLPGVYALREYRRYYPAGEVTGHVVGFTSVDDAGQEGLELAFDGWLRGESGSKRVLRDGRGRTVEDVESIKPPRPGKTLTTSIDLPVQYLAYRELKRAVSEHGAKSGSVVVIDIDSGELLAMANQPSYNPNDRSQYSVSRYRNRAVTDIFEPGSSLKPLIAAAALETGRYHPHTVIETDPGYMMVGPKLIQDANNFGRLDLGGILKKSSNVGITKIALDMEADELWSVLADLGLGRLTASGFPGESAGLLNSFQHWRPIGQATLAYGYGLSVTSLQLAQAYATIGAGGVHRPVRFTHDPEKRGTGHRVISERTAGQLIDMMESVIEPDGTGHRAAVDGFRVAGKTGTARKVEAGGYSDERHLAAFAGVAPASDPELAVVVVLDEPGGEAYYGGEVAAPVFSRVMSGALRLLAIAPDGASTLTPGEVLQAHSEVPQARRERRE